MAESKRLTVSLSEEAVAKLEWIAKSKGITLAEALRRAIATEGYILQEIGKGRQVLIRDPGSSEVRELVFR
jgi:hypothetical protein